MMNKQEMRRFYKTVRNSITYSEKVYLDKLVFTAFINSDIFKNSNLLLIYVSVGSEIDTHNIIDFALQCGKRVAVPFCVEKEMSFFEIYSLSELVTGKFGIPTVNSGNNYEVTDFRKAVCVVPGLCFDNYGGRIGYGGGYYDRFLAFNNIVSVGLCFERCISHKIPSEKHDIKIDYILTENRLIKSEI